MADHGSSGSSVACLPLHILIVSDDLRSSHWPKQYAMCANSMSLSKYSHHGIVMIRVPVCFPQGLLSSLRKILCLSHLQSQHNAQCLERREQSELQKEKSDWMKYFQAKYLWGFVKKSRMGTALQNSQAATLYKQRERSAHSLLKLLAQWDKNWKHGIFFLLCCPLEIVTANKLLCLLFLEGGNKMSHVIIWIICLPRLVEKLTCKLNSRVVGGSFQRLVSALQSQGENDRHQSVLWTYESSFSPNTHFDVKTA